MSYYIVIITVILSVESAFLISLHPHYITLKQHNDLRLTWYLPV